MAAGPKPPLIRPARAADRDRLTEIAKDAYAVYLERMPVRPAPIDADYGAAIDRGDVWVLDGEPPGGFLVLVEYPNHLWVDNVAIDPPLQGKGLGRKLLSFAEEAAATRGLPELRLLTSVKMTENLALYDSLGYSEYDRRDEAGRMRVYLRKPLLI